MMNRKEDFLLRREGERERVPTPICQTCTATRFVYTTTDQLIWISLGPSAPNGSKSMLLKHFRLNSIQLVMFEKSI